MRQNTAYGLLLVSLQVDKDEFVAAQRSATGDQARQRKTAAQIEVQYGFWFGDFERIAAHPVDQIAPGDMPRSRPSLRQVSNGRSRRKSLAVRRQYKWTRTGTVTRKRKPPGKRL